MERPVWIYRLGDMEYGPCTAEEIWHKRDEGLIDEETLIKGNGYSDWVPFKSIRELNVDFLDVAPPITKHELDEHPSRPKDEHLKRWVRPWIRFWARLIDYSLLFLLALPFLNYALSIAPLWLHLPFISFIWVFVESLLLTTWGTTPGKWFMQVHISADHERKPVWAQAFKRSFTVWWRGLGAGLPLISLIAAIVANWTLANTSTTPWDKAGSFEVIHKRIGFWRTFFVTLYFIFWLALIRPYLV